MKHDKYVDKGAELRDDSYRRAAEESNQDEPSSANSIKIAYTPSGLLAACQSGLTTNEDDSDADK